MGFKLKKKNTGEGSNRKVGHALLTKIQAQTDQLSRVFGDSEKSKPLILGAIFCLVLALFLLLYLFYSVPRNNELTRSVGDLRLLSQTISRQATEATASGTKESIDKLTQSQKAFAENLETVKDIHAQTQALSEVEKQWKAVSDGIDLISSQQKIINQLYDTNIAIGETIPGIQAEYNLMVDQMARQNMP
ncbi:MAG: chemotaxis protein, partial [Acinetobacter harbinensis]|nr:chemotaxis protein [Acinetobacter harbinensis]